MPRKSLSWLLRTALAGLLLTVAGIIAAPGSAQAAVPVPSSMSALGDSMTRAYNTCGFFSDCIENSWSTGTSIDSHYQRIRAKNPAIDGKNHNDARSGADMDDLNGQAQTAVSRGVQYVTVLMGHNDACKETEADMTPLDTFEAELRAGMTTLRDGLPDAAIFVGSIVDINRLWEIGKGNKTATDRWALLGICQSLLANPDSTAQADVDRRNRVRQRVIDYNAILAQVCAENPNCKFDNNALFNYPYTLEHVSTWDYFHADKDGQRLIAELTYTNGWNW